MTFLFTKKKSSPKHFVTILLTAFAVVLVWRGMWGIMDQYLFPDQPMLSYLISLLLGLFILWVDDKELTELEY